MCKTCGTSSTSLASSWPEDIERRWKPCGSLRCRFGEKEYANKVCSISKFCFLLHLYCELRHLCHCALRPHTHTPTKMATLLHLALMFLRLMFPWLTLATFQPMHTDFGTRNRGLRLSWWNLYLFVPPAGPLCYIVLSVLPVFLSPLPSLKCWTVFSPNIIFVWMLEWADVKFDHSRILLLYFGGWQANSIPSWWGGDHSTSFAATIWGGVYCIEWKFIESIEFGQTIGLQKESMSFILTRWPTDCETCERGSASIHNIINLASKMRYCMSVHLNTNRWINTGATIKLACLNIGSFEVLTI